MPAGSKQGNLLTKIKAILTLVQDFDSHWLR